MFFCRDEVEVPKVTKNNFGEELKNNDLCNEIMMDDIVEEMALGNEGIQLNKTVIKQHIRNVTDIEGE